MVRNRPRKDPRVLCSSANSLVMWLPLPFLLVPSLPEDANTVSLRLAGPHLTVSGGRGQVFSFLAKAWWMNASWLFRATCRETRVPTLTLPAWSVVPGIKNGDP